MRGLVLLTLFLAVSLAIPTAATETQEVGTQGASTRTSELLPQVAPKALGYIAMGAVLCALPNAGTRELGENVTELGTEALALAVAVDYNLPIRYYLAYEFNTTYGKLSSPTYWTEVCFNAVASIGVNMAMQSLLQSAAKSLGVPPDEVRYYVIQTCRLMAKLQSGSVNADDVVPLIDSVARIVAPQSNIPRDKEYELAGVVANLLNRMRTDPGVRMISSVCDLILRYLDTSASSGIKRWMGALLAPVIPDVFGILSDVREILSKINNALIGLKALTNPTEFLRETARAAGASLVEALKPVAEKATVLGLSKEEVENMLEGLKSVISDLAAAVSSDIAASYGPVIRALGAVMVITSLMDVVNSFNRLTQKLSKLAVMARSFGVSVPSPVKPEEELKRALEVLQRGRIGPPPLPF
ncbi:hypothetical protein [Methanopyrus sp.]